MCVRGDDLVSDPLKKLLIPVRVSGDGGWSYWGLRRSPLTKNCFDPFVFRPMDEFATFLDFSFFFFTLLILSCFFLFPRYFR